MSKAPKSLSQISQIPLYLQLRGRTPGHGPQRVLPVCLCHYLPAPGGPGGRRLIRVATGKGIRQDTDSQREIYGP